MIDPKKIEEWKRLAEGGEAAAFVACAREAVPALIAEREDLLARLQKTEQLSAIAASTAAACVADLKRERRELLAILNKSGIDYPHPGPCSRLADRDCK